MVDFVRAFTTRTERPTRWVLPRLGVPAAQFYRWVTRYGAVPTHHGLIPRDHWLHAWERHAIVAFHDQHPLDGYRRLAFMMLDADVVAVSPATVYRVLTAAGRLDRWQPKPSRKGTGFVPPLAPHEHWHMDITYVNLAGTCYYLCGVLDGFSRAMLHCEVRARMTEADLKLQLFIFCA